MRVLLVLASALVVLTAACGDDDDDDNDANDDSEVVTTEFAVDSVEVLQLESFPVQISVEATGTLPDGCTEVSNVDVAQDGSQFTVAIETERPTDVACTLQIREHTESVSLGSPEPGDYTVTVNGVSEEFIVPGDASGDNAEEPCSPASSDPDASVSSEDPPPCPEETVDESQYEIAEFGVNDIEIAIAESFPVQIFVAVHGNFSDGCTEIHEVNVEQQGNEFLIEITTRRPIGAICTQAIVEHTENVPLGSPSAGDYTVTVNGISEDFTVPG
ncbi:MAG TPA: hypothetical protein VFO84_09410 [Dehalococcoidia bacterium]|nr:hypothetical protein [Dehalococcoidia bacterium]